jgi:arginyl-tRNA synthetase
MHTAPLQERVAFLGRAYAFGATEFEKNTDLQTVIGQYNERVYERDVRILEIYNTTRQWSLDYFDTIYAKLGTKYDHLYFESEMYARGVELVHEFLEKGVFATGDGGAIIFPGSAYGLHDRVFVNSKGYPTYEAKEVALAEKHFTDYHPDRVIHVVGKEQTEYFKVVIKAMESVVADSVSKEYHLVGGYLQLKGEQKMSSRKGNVITGDDLIAAVEEQVVEVMNNVTMTALSATTDIDETRERIAMAALKYTMLRGGVSDDIAFDMKTSVAIEGESGPYLLYIVARINSIIAKSKIINHKSEMSVILGLELPEKQLLMTLADFPDVVRSAAESLDPSHIAQYVFTLAQRFNSFYATCPVLTAEVPVQQFRLKLIDRVRTVMVSGLDLLGIETVDVM